ncbi:MAG: hypothetical protein QOE76_736 [Frankiales bacterium]|jgi:hypothetical protein|nr:hypothetical protein [Frankiales bacterium]
MTRGLRCRSLSDASSGRNTQTAGRTCAIGTVAGQASRGLAKLRAQDWADRPDTLRTEP